MSDNNQDTQQQNDTNSLSIGEILSQARKAKNVDIEGVTQYINVPTQHLTSLEENRFDDLPNTLFCQGYLRSYANYLELDSESLVERLNQELNVKPTKKALNQSTISGSSKTVKLNQNNWQKKLAYILLPVLGFAAVYFFIAKPMLNQQQAEAPSEVEVIVDQPVETVDVSGLIDQESIDNVLSASVVEANMTATAVSATVVTETTATAATTETLDATASDTSSVTTQSAQQASTETVVANAATASVISSATSSVVTKPAAAGEKKISVEYIDDAWTEIQDGNGKKWVYTTKHRGERVDLNLVPPIYVKLGKPSASVIHLDGQLVSIKTEVTDSPISFYLE